MPLSTAHESALGVKLTASLLASMSCHAAPLLPVSRYCEVLHAVTHMGGVPDDADLLVTTSDPEMFGDRAPIENAFFLGENLLLRGENLFGFIAKGVG